MWLDSIPRKFYSSLNPSDFSEDENIDVNAAINFFIELHNAEVLEARYIIKCPVCNELCTIDHNKRKESYECDECGNDFVPEPYCKNGDIIYKLIKEKSINKNTSQSKIVDAAIALLSEETERSNVIRLEDIMTKNSSTRQVDIMKSTRIEKFDMAIITAVQDTEYRAVLDLPCNWHEFRIENDDTIYQKSTWEKNDKSISVVAACAFSMGMPAAATLTMKMITNFEPSYIAMVGIAGGIEEDLEIGDIIIVDQSWNYENGKRVYNEEQELDIFKPEPIPLRVEQSIIEEIKNYIFDKKNISAIADKWTYSNIKRKLSARIGAMACGSAVVTSPTTLKQITEGNRKVLGVEMESYGVLCAAHVSKNPKPTVIIAKSVSDHANKNKIDDTQPYAAYTSARFLYNFSLDILIDKF